MMSFFHGKRGLSRKLARRCGVVLLASCMMGLQGVENKLTCKKSIANDYANVSQQSKE